MRAADLIAVYLESSTTSMAAWAEHPAPHSFSRAEHPAQAFILYPLSVPRMVAMPLGQIIAPLAYTSLEGNVVIALLPAWM